MKRSPGPASVNEKLCLRLWHDDDFGHQHQCGEPRGHSGKHRCSVLVKGTVCPATL